MQILIGLLGEFAFSDRHLQRLREAAPGATLVVKDTADVTREDVHAADIIFGWPNREWVVDAPKLKWVQLASAGSDGWFGLRPDIILTKSNGVFGVPISEWAIGSLLMLTRKLHRYRDQQRQALWKEVPGADEVYGRTVGIVGLGNIGQEVGRRAQALGCRVIGFRRTVGAPPPPFIDEVMPLDDLLPQTDFLVLAVPNTPETRGLISRERLARLKKGAHLINVGRGATVDEAAMIDALLSGHLEGAALDVTTVEPLAADSPLWQMEQVIITPHVSGRSVEGNASRRLDIFCDNLRRFQAGVPLRNLVDRKAGY